MPRMVSRTWTIAAMVLLGLAVPGLAGCTQNGTDTASPASGAPSTSAAAGPSDGGPGAATSTEPAPSAPPAKSPLAADEPLLSYSRSGGIAGANDRIVLNPDGSYMLQTHTITKQGKLTAAEVTALRSTLDAAHFTDIPAVGDGGNVADGYTYTVTYGGHQVVAHDGAVPPVLQPVIGVLNQLLAR